MSSKLYDVVKLAFHSTLDFSGAYTIAQLNDAFFGNAWLNNKLDQGINDVDSSMEHMWSLVIRVWLQVMMTALIGSEVRYLFFPADQQDTFSIVLFVMGIVQQPGLFKRLGELEQYVVNRINGWGLYPPPIIGPPLKLSPP